MFYFFYRSCCQSTNFRERIFLSRQNSSRRQKITPSMSKIWLKNHCLVFKPSLFLFSFYYLVLYILFANLDDYFTHVLALYLFHILLVVCGIFRYLDLVLIHYPKPESSANDDPRNSQNRKDCYVALEGYKGMLSYDIFCEFLRITICHVVLLPIAFASRTFFVPRILFSHTK